MRTCQRCKDDVWGSMYCKMCHSSKCFACILKLGIHSAEVISLEQSDESHLEWHEGHIDKTRNQTRERVIQAEVDGLPCDLGLKIAITASRYDTCMPLNSEFTVPGWYDKFTQTSTVSHFLLAKYAYQ